MTTDISRGFQAYQTYLALKRHFTTNSYDYFKYRGKVKVSLDAFLKRNDRYTFARLERAYPKDLVPFLVSNLVEDPNAWVGNLSETTFAKWKKRQESLTYKTTEELRAINDYLVENDLEFDKLFDPRKEIPELLLMLMRKEVSYETVIILNSAIGFLPHWYKYIDDFVWSNQKQVLQKYSPFVSFDKEKMKQIIRKIFC